MDLAVDGAGDVYVAEVDALRVQKLSADEGVIELSSNGQVLGSWSARGTTPGSLMSPSGIASDAAGAIYVVDNRNNWVQTLALTGPAW
jgi:DNA-binding beta-propeller fold protein YncE